VAYDSYGNPSDTYEPAVRTHMTYDVGGRIQSSEAGYGTSLARTTNTVESNQPNYSQLSK